MGREKAVAVNAENRLCPILRFVKNFKTIVFAFLIAYAAGRAKDQPTQFDGRKRYSIM